MKNITLVNAAKACGGTLFGVDGWTDGQLAQEASCVVMDSRKIGQGGIFIAAKGEKADGHSFIPSVSQKGAMGVICERAPENCRIPYILVEDSFKALKDLAEFYRRQLSLPVIGITGSVGKTSTKEFIAAVLSRKYKVLKTQGNYNNEVGLPLTVLSIREEHQAAVLEMGISDFGEMHRLSKIARPDICVITNIGQCHLENLGSREGILKAKSEIFDFMNPDGYVLVNGDDDLLAGLSVQVSGFHRVGNRAEGQGGAEKAGSHKMEGMMDGRETGCPVCSHAPVHFGLAPVNEIYASDIVGKGLLGTAAMIHADTKVPGLYGTGNQGGWGLPDSGKREFSVEIPLPGEHMVRNALAAAGAGFLMGLTDREIQEGISGVESVSGRSHLMKLPGCMLIDDCYNANPVSVRAALDLLATAPGRKVAILGDMFELGEREKQLHGEIGAYGVDAGIDMLLCVGNLSAYMYEQGRAHKEEQQNGALPGEGPGKGGNTELYYFSTRNEMVSKLPELLEKDDTILVKASHGMQFEKVVEAIAKLPVLGYTD